MRRFPKKPKSYNPVRVVDPSGPWHTARVHPCQSLHLIMRLPCAWFDWASKEDVFEFEVNSDLLVMEEVSTEEDGKTSIIISPKYDLSEWVAYSEVALGDIHIFVKGKDHSVRVCVIQCAAPDKSEVLTVVNPNKCAVKLESHQTLEVVCYEPSWSDDPKDVWEFRCADKTEYSSSYRLVQERYEVLGDHGAEPAIIEGKYALKNRFHLRANPKLSKPFADAVEEELKLPIKPALEHHWWLQWDNELRQKINGLGNGSHDCGIVKFRGECKRNDSSDYQIRQMELVLAVHAKHKNKISSPVAESIEDKYELRRRIETNGLLQNPFGLELVDFHPGMEEMVIEIAPPDVYWSDLSDSDDWTISLDDHILQPKNMLELIPLPPSIQRGKRFQRFRIKCLASNSILSGEAKFLGAVKVVCKKKEECYEGLKRISCWMAKISAISSPSVGWYQQPPTNFSKGKRRKQSVSMAADDGKYNGTPRFYEVTLEDLEVDNLEDKAKTELVFIVAEPKKKLEENQSNQFLTTTFNNVNQPIPTKLSGDSASVKPENSNVSPESSTGSAPLTMTPFVTINTAPFIIHSPEDGQLINLEYGQFLILRISPHADELWVPEVTGNLVIRRSRIQVVGTSSYQEMLVSPKIENIPLISGDHHVGTLVLRSSDSTISLSIMVVLPADAIDKTLNKMKVNLPLPMRLIELSNKKSTFGSTAIKFVRDWRHEDAVLLTSDEVLYLKNAPSSSLWVGDWQIDIEQLPLLPQVWHKIGYDYADINPLKIWFDVPQRQGALYVFRPIKESQPLINKIVKALREAGDDKYLIARVTFKNSTNQHNTSVKTEFGQMTRKYSVARTLGIYLDLANRDEKKTSSCLTLTDPKSEALIDVCNHSMVIVKLTPDFVEWDSDESLSTSLYQLPWYPITIPTFMKFKGRKMDRGFNEISFEVVERTSSEPQRQTLKFICGNKKSVSVRANYLT